MKIKIVLGLLLVVLFVTGCKTPKLQEHTTTDSRSQTNDSTNRLEVRTVKPFIVPQSTAKLNLDPAVLAKLPQGAKFESKQGNATATATIAPDGTIEITANCDSLMFLVENVQIEVYRLQKENTALKTSSIKKETKGLSGWQNFQIYGFRICMILLAIRLTYKTIKRKWQGKKHE